MKIKFNQKEGKNKLYIQIENKFNTRKKEIKDSLKEIKLGKEKFKVIKISSLNKGKLENTIFLKVKNQAELEKNLEDIVIQIKNSIKSSKENFNISFKELKLNEELEESFIELLSQAFYEFNKYKSKKDEKQLNIITNLNSEKLEKKIKNIFWARDLQNMPANELNPTNYEKIIKDNFKNLPVEIKVIKGEELNKIGAGGIYSVGKGSIHGPRMIILKYSPKKGEKYTALVGKGVTFDSGGYNIKPTGYMEDMNLDMGGSAVALGAFKYLVENNFEGNLICGVGIVENLVSSKSYTPTDIIKMYNGKTVRVFNTDAEGRLVLADVLSYLEKNYEISKIFDFATLTGAAIVALGNDIIATLGRNKNYLNKLHKIGENIKEHNWELPLFEKYKEDLKDDKADLRNCSSSRAAGTITAALFLSEFVKNKNWVHFDIAGPDICKNHKLYGTGGTAIGLRLIVNFIESQNN